MICELIIFKFLTLLFSSGQEKNFNKYPASEVDFAGGMYDFDSLMHYGNYAFSKNRKPTLVALKNPKLQFGRRLKLSKTDILQLNYFSVVRSKMQQLNTVCMQLFIGHRCLVHWFVSLHWLKCPLRHKVSRKLTHTCHTNKILCVL